jgi:hypothetical protein
MTILADDPDLRRRSSIGRSRIGSGAEAPPGDALLPGSITGILFRLSPARVLVFLLGVAITLAGTSLILQGLYHSGQPVPMGVLVRLDLDRENNIPTWFSSALLATAALLLFFIARAMSDLRAPHAPYWLGLALVFLYLSVDETASLHEAAIGPIQRTLNATGALYAAWVIPAMVMVPIFAAIYLRFLWSLPRRTAVLFVLAGAIYVGGALGLEMVGWHHRYPLHAPNPTDWEASKTMTYAVINHAEEFMEMTGAIIFVYALLSYVRASRLAMVVRCPRPRADTAGAMGAKV